MNRTVTTILMTLSILVVAVSPVAAQTNTFTPQGQSTEWHDDLNWSRDIPTSSEDVVIPSGELCIISTGDGVCKTLDIEATSRLEIKGKTLTLGASDTPTTSNLDAGTPDGTIRLVRVGFDYGTLSVHKWVTFTGGGTIEALTSSDAGIIDRASGSDGIIISAGTSDNAVFGNITLLCDVDNKGTRFGIDGNGQLMVFGSDDGQYLAPLLSGDGEFSAIISDGKIQFRIVLFASSAPNWVIHASEIEVTDDGGSGHWVDVPFDIDMNIKNAVLDLDHDFSCTGTLHITADGDLAHTIEVASGKVAEWKP